MPFSTCGCLIRDPIKQLKKLVRERDSGKHKNNIIRCTLLYYLSGRSKPHVPSSYVYDGLYLCKRHPGGYVLIKNDTPIFYIIRNLLAEWRAEP